MMVVVKFIIQLLAAPARGLFWLIIKLLTLLPRQIWLRSKVTSVLKWASGNLTWSILSSICIGMFGWGSIQTVGIYGDPWKSKLPSPCSPDRICIVVAGLQGDEDGLQTSHVTFTLENAFNLEGQDDKILIQTIPQRYSRKLVGNSSEILRDTQENARRWLTQQNGDILISGLVAKEDKVLRLYLLSRQSISTSGYVLNERLELPANFTEDLGDILVSDVARSLAGLADSDELSDKLLLRSVDRLRSLAETPPTDFKKVTKGQLHYSYANALLTLSMNTSLSKQFENSISSFQRSIFEWDKTEYPTHWALGKSGLGAAYLEAGRRQADVGLLNKAILAFTASLTVYSEEKYPEYWATIHSNIGLAHRLLGDFRDDIPELEKAIDAYAEVLSLRNRDATPYEWADATSSLAGVYAVIGQITPDIEYLDRSLSTYEEALEELSREHTPYRWAIAQQGAATTLWLISEQSDGNPELLEKSLKKFKQADEVFSEDGYRFAWGTIQTNIVVLTNEIAMRNSDSKTIIESLNDYKELISLTPKDELPERWAQLQVNLGNAHSYLARNQFKQHYRDAALTAYEHALSIWSKNRSPLDWADVRINIGILLSAEVTNEDSLSNLKKSITSLESALNIYNHDTHKKKWATIQKNLARAYGKLGVQERRVTLLQKSLEAAQSSAVFFSREDFPTEWADLQMIISGSFGGLALLDENSLENLVLASTHANDAFEYYNNAGLTVEAQRAKQTVEGYLSELVHLDAQ